jgi:hypothetical protein
MATKFDKFIKWEEANFKWEEAKGDSPYKDHTGKEFYTWEDVFLVTEILDAVEEAGGGASLEDVIQKLPDDKKKKCITLVMHRKGVKVYDEKKCVKNIKAYAKEIKLIAEELRSKITVEI